MKKPKMSSWEELKPSPSVAAVDNITTAVAAKSAKRPRDDADFVGGIDEVKMIPNRSQTGSSAAASDMTLQHTLPTNKKPAPVAAVDVHVNGLFPEI